MAEEKIISEYNVNRFLYSIPRAKTEDYVIKDCYNNIMFSAKAGCTFTLHCYQLLDCIASIIRKGMELHYEYHGLRLNQITDVFKLMDYPHLIEHLEDGKEELDQAQFKMSEIYKVPIKIPMTKILNHPTTKVMQRHGVIKALKQLNEFEFKTVFKFYANKDMQGKEVKNGYNGVYSNLDKEYSKLFNIELVDNDLILNFNTIFGYIFKHNICTKGFSYQNETFEEIKKCSTNSKLVFRRFILPYTYTTKLTVDKVITHLGIKPENSWVSKKTLDRIVNELADNKLIDIESKSLTKGDYHYKVNKSISEHI